MNTENSAVSKYTAAFGLSLAFSSVANAVLVVVKEKSPAVQSAMKRLTGHHWITHALVILLLFGVCGWFLTRSNRGQGVAISANRLLKTIVGGVVAAGLIIIGFYLIAD